MVITQIVFDQAFVLKIVFSFWVQCFDTITCIFHLTQSNAYHCYIIMLPILVCMYAFSFVRSTINMPDNLWETHVTSLCLPEQFSATFSKQTLILKFKNTFSKNYQNVIFENCHSFGQNVPFVTLQDKLLTNSPKRHSLYDV